MSQRSEEQTTTENSPKITAHDGSERHASTAAIGIGVGTEVVDEDGDITLTVSEHDQQMSLANQQRRQTSS